ncbi:hypothetical protein F5Y12DRAFT_736797 [Xylaria sp. FL1777]|nr:hypothetical protein F5Y12DRAFT_736797 [Xylaria sp. FL1777]
MEAVENNTEPAPSTEAKLEFPFYPRLPPELKLMVWKYVYAYWSAGVQRVRLSIDPANPSRLVVRPDDNQKKDASTWRERRNLSQIDRYSYDYFLRFERRAKVLYKDSTPRRSARAKEKCARTLVDCDTDVVTFRFNYGETRGSLSLLTIRDNLGVFAGITRIGVDVEFLEQGFKGTRKYKPFECTCTYLVHEHDSPCAVAIVRFIQFFENLKTFYVISSIMKGGRGKGYISRYLLGLAASKENKRTVFRYIQEKAQENGLNEFHDRTGTYCEILNNELDNLYYLQTFRHVVNIKYEWKKEMRGHPRKHSIEFKALMWGDVQDTTVKGDEQLLQDLRQWY